MLMETGLPNNYMKTHNKKKEFYPDYLIEIIFVVFITIELVLILALLYSPRIGRPIDFSAQFQPKPEWYFLWLYQLVRYFPGKTAFIGTVLIPLFSVILLALIPYIDKGPRGRLKAILVGAILLLAFIVLTLIPAFS